MLTVQIPAPAYYPAFVRNTDLRQGAMLVRLPEFVTGNRALRCLPMPLVIGQASLIGSQGLARILSRIAPVPVTGALRRAIHALQLRPVFPRLDPRAEVVIGHGLMPVVLGRRKPLLYGPGYVASDYFDPDDPQGKLELAVRDEELRAQCRSTEGIFLTNGDAVRRWNKHIGRPGPDQVFTIPCLMPNAPRSDSLIAPVKPSTGPIELLFVGGMARRKNLPRIIAALEQLAPTHAFRLTVVSGFVDGPVDVDRSWIRYYPELPNARVVEMMRESHVFVMPSLRESFGMVFAEALSAGCAILAPRRAAQIDMLGDAAVYAEPTDITSIRAAAEELLGHRSWKAVAERAIERYARRFAPDFVANSFYDAAEMLASRAGT